LPQLWRAFAAARALMSWTPEKMSVSMIRGLGVSLVFVGSNCNGESHADSRDFQQHDPCMQFYYDIMVQIRLRVIVKSRRPQLNP
jgi:hypothetical protein